MRIVKRKITKNDKKNYQKYLLSKKWKSFRQKAFEFYGDNCGKCGSKYHLQVHHKTYRNIYKETLSDVIVLCDKCHKHAHKLKKRNQGSKSSRSRNAFYEKSATTFYPDRKRPAVSFSLE